MERLKLGISFFKFFLCVMKNWSDMYYIVVLLDISLIIICWGSFRILLVFLYLLFIFCYFEKVFKSNVC